MPRRSLTQRLTIGLTTVWMLGGAAGALQSPSGSILSGFLGAQAAQAADNVRRTPSMRQNIYKRFSRIRELADAGNVNKAMTVINDMQAGTDLNSYEAAMLWKLKAFLFYQTKDYPQAAKAYQQLLEQPNLPLSLEQDTWYSLTKLHMVLEDYDQALAALDHWFQLSEDPGPDAYITKAQILYQIEQYQPALEAIDTGIIARIKSGQAVPENWYLLKRYGYYQLENYGGLKNVLVTLVKQYPKREYLIQLAAVYGELNQPQKQLAIKEAAYDKGYLDKESSLLNLAQLMLAEGSSYKAAKVIEKGIRDGIIEPKADNLKQMGDSFLLAKEYDQALAAFQKAAAKSGDGELYLRMAQIASDLTRWEDARDYAEQAIAAGDFERIGMAHVVHGLALFNLDQLSQAMQAFNQARRYDATQQVASQWRNYVQKEQARRHKLEAASREESRDLSKG
ncbi:hypothetical protein QQM79_09725 [Marinobacteraceae bacterium S3BR75-40.1]